MNAASPGTIHDPRGFVLEGRSVEGRVALADLPRLRDVLAGPAGEVSYAIVGKRDERGRWCLEVSIRARPVLVCQRCLKDCEQDVGHVSNVLLARDDAEAAQWDIEDAGAEVMVVGDELDIVDLVEQELLLALPYAPMHPEGGCAEEVPSAPVG